MASSIPTPYRGGRPSRLNDPDFCYQAASYFVAGLTRDEMCDLLDIKDPKTITRYRKDPRVSALVRKMIQERVQAVVSKTDAEIHNRLSDPEKLTVKELIEIRKEFLGGQLRDVSNEIDEQTINEAQQALEANPDLADEFRALLARGMQASRPITPGE